jgi:hypothetical protein
MQEVKEIDIDVDDLAPVFELQIALLRQWCDKNSWTNFQLDNNFQCYACPSGSESLTILPDSAMAILRENEAFFNELRAYQFCKMNLKSATTTVLLNTVTSAVGIPTFTAWRKEPDFPKVSDFVFGCVIAAILVVNIANAAFALYSWHRCRKLRSSLALKLASLDQD